MILAGRGLSLCMTRRALTWRHHLHEPHLMLNEFVLHLLRRSHHVLLLSRMDLAGVSCPCAGRPAAPLWCWPNTGVVKTSTERIKSERLQFIGGLPVIQRDEWVSAWIPMVRLIIGFVIKDESDLDDLRGDREKNRR